MKIYSSRLSDLKDRRANLQKEIEDNNDRWDKETEEYNKILLVQAEPARQAAVKIFDKYPMLNAEITAEYTFSDYIIVKIEVDSGSLHDPNSALSWRYTLKIDSETGELIRESNSWSGLDATTPESLESLQQTLSALKDLYNTDWKSILSVKRPEYGNFVTTNRRNFSRESSSLDQEIFEAEIEEAVGKNIAFKVGSFAGSDYQSANRSPFKTSSYHWVVFDRETPSQYYITEFSAPAGDSGEFERRSSRSSHRVKKSSVLNALIHPLESKQF